MMSFFDDRRGAAIVEFAFVAPVLLTLIFGGLDLGYGAYVKAILEGEMQKASRDRTLESAESDATRKYLEDRVLIAVRRLAPEAKVEFTRKAYRDYTNVVSIHEEFNDASENGKCDPGEFYLDANNNGIWDINGGILGSDGSAKDVVLYTATLNYDQLPFGSILPWRRGAKITARTALRNQPFDKQASSIERSCR